MTGHGERGGTQDGRTGVPAVPGGPDSSSGADGAPVSPSRDELLTLMREWGWRMESEWPGRYQVWEHGRAQAIVPSDPELADYDDLMRQAWAVLGTAEGPRLLRVVREVAALADDLASSPAVGSSSAEQWEFDTRRQVATEIRAALAALTGTTKGETDAS